MANSCESCPILTKIDYCCSSNPETGETRLVWAKKSKQEISVCDNLGTDGMCEIYSERPPQCIEYVCEGIYAQGLNSSSI